jgi:hypothetical protein
MSVFHPDQIRGCWTLGELVSRSGISKEIFAKKIRFPPDTPDAKFLKDIVLPLGKEVEAFRETLRLKGGERQGIRAEGGAGRTSRPFFFQPVGLFFPGKMKEDGAAGPIGWWCPLKIRMCQFFSINFIEIPVRSVPPGIRGKR